jgi:hypothetical protein
VNVKYTIGAYSPVEFGWRKSCSQVGTHQGLVISTSSSAHGGDVYTNGAVVVRCPVYSVYIDRYFYFYIY